MNFDALFVNPKGRTSQAEFVPALVVVLAAVAFFGYMVGGRTAEFCMLVLMYPAFVLLARRLQDMGQSLWLVFVPLIPVIAAFMVRLGYISLGDTINAALPWLALAVSAGFVLWACAKK